MLRRTVFLLIALLALQFTWSAVAAYCMHETGRAAHHLGHHPHADAGEHTVSVSKDDPAPSKKSPHSHCAACAHGTLSVDGLQVLAYARPAGMAPVSTNMILSTFYTAPPERPQWHTAV